jgi:hypothetical protein
VEIGKIRECERIRKIVPGITFLAKVEYAMGKADLQKP